MEVIEEEKGKCFNCQSENDNQIACKICKEWFCHQCASNKALLYSCEEGKGEYEVCTGCHSLIVSLEDFIEREGIKWCQMTKRGESWMKSSGAWSFMENQPGDINTYLILPLSTDDEEIITKDVTTGRSDPEVFNWEIHELLLRIIGGTYREDIYKVLKAYTSRNPQVGYCQGMNYICMWLLVFLDHNSAFWMLSYLIEKWLLPDFYNGAKRGNSLNGFFIESTVIAGLLDHLIPGMKSSCLTSHEFSDFFSMQPLIQMFVNTVDLESLVFLWDRLASEGSIALIRGVVSIVSIFERNVKKGEHPLKILQQMAGQRIAPQLSLIYDDLMKEITEVRVRRLRGGARDYRAKQWQKSERILEKKLENCSNFSKEEIDILKSEFTKMIEQKRKEPKEKPNVNIRRRGTVFLPDSIQQEVEKYGGGDIGLAKPEFVRLVQNLVPGLAESAESLFDQFDEDRSGYLDFREFTICISVLSKGTFSDKLKLCFDSYDSNHTGILHELELNLLTQNLLSPYIEALGECYDPLLKQKAEQIYTQMKALISSTNGSVVFSEFYNKVIADPVLYACLSDHVGAKEQDLNHVTSAISRSTFISPLDEEKFGKSSCNSCSLM
ncbi:unnamed protein product [Blepharisma stoltei]|uniref:Uncharacterized protein n=1 Tax=Blepharisma stoltei TaxID=1481888 RepID=A0AAU9J7Q9_9CILI|nr:unnamed protein product [Blepharisma stoltei]